MATIDSTKKQPADTPIGTDWHNADIVAALVKAGWSLRRLSLHHGYSNPQTLNQVLQRRWPKGQRLIAAAIGVPPENIWPSRYRQTISQSNRERACA